MAIATLGFWLVVAYAVREVLGGRVREPAPPTTPPTEPLRLLDARLARGDIDVEEYQRTRQLITSGH